VVASIIDGVVVGVPGMVVMGVMLAGSFSRLEIDPVTGQLTSGAGSVVGAYFFGYAVILAIGTLYFGIMNGGAKGQTLGKMAMKIQVRSATNGGPIGIGRGIGRYLLIIPLTLLCGVGQILDGLWPLWDAKRQALHDKAVNSVVVDVP
jgi:uncharacterized RDD family membrane protein YckC